MSSYIANGVLTLERAKAELNKTHHAYQSAQVNRMAQGYKPSPEVMNKEQLAEAEYLKSEHSYMLAKTAVDKEYAHKKIESFTNQLAMVKGGCKAIEQVHGINGSSPESKALLASYVNKAEMLSNTIDQIRRYL